MLDAFEDKATDQEYMQAYANTFVGGVLNTVVTMYATQIGMGVFVGINPFSSGISKGLMNIPKAIFSKAGTINAINLGRGFYNLSMASSYEVLDQQKEKYLNSKTQAYIKSGLSQAAATRKARQDYNQTTNYGAANQTYMTAKS